MNDQLFNSIISSLVRAGLMASAGALAIKVQAHDMDTTVGIVTSIVLAGVSLLWSAVNHKKNIDAPPPPPSGGSTSGGIMGMILGVTLGGVVAFGTVNASGCKGGAVTAAQVAEWRAEADKGEADLQAQIDEAAAAGNTEAAAKAQKILDQFRQERAKFESNVKFDEQGNLDVESSVASAALLALPPTFGAVGLALLAVWKRVRAARATPPTPPTVS